MRPLAALLVLMILTVGGTHSTYAAPFATANGAAPADKSIGVFGFQSAAKGAPKKAAPAPAAPELATAIREIRVEGSSFYTPAQVIALSGLKAGDEPSKANFERARDRVIESGCFETFAWRYETSMDGGVRVTLQVSEVDRFYDWMLDRVPVTARDFYTRALREVPLFGVKIPASEKFLERSAELLARMAAEKGGKEPMTGRLLLVGKDQVRVVFGPKTPPPTVTDVVLEGSRILDARYLRKVLADVALGHPYLEANFRLFLDSQLRPVYEAVGRLRVKFPRVVTEPAPSGNGVLVRVTVEEGDPYKLEKIDIEGTPLGPEEIEREGNFKLGETVSYAEIGKSLKRIQEVLKSRGYMKTSYQAFPEINDEKKTVSVRVEMAMGEEYTFGKLTIKGLDLETEPVIRKLWAMKAGDTYRAGYAEMFLGTVRDRGIFDNLGETKAEEKMDEKTRVVDVLLIFKGEKPKPERRRPEQ